MADFANAIAIIRQYEGFNEKAYPHFETGGAPYTLGYGTQFYPDGAPVQRGQRVTKEKALEYLKAELDVISDQLAGLDLILTSGMEEALISFVHSIGWDNFCIAQSLTTLSWAICVKLRRPCSTGCLTPTNKP